MTAVIMLECRIFTFFVSPSIFLFFFREELLQCRQNIASMTNERSQLEQQIEQTRKAFSAWVEHSFLCSNVKLIIFEHLNFSCAFFFRASVFRLRVKLRKLCLNLQREEELQGEINTKLKQQEWVRHGRKGFWQDDAALCGNFILPSIKATPPRNREQTWSASLQKKKA